MLHETGPCIEYKPTFKATHRDVLRPPQIANAKAASKYLPGEEGLRWETPDWVGGGVVYWLGLCGNLRSEGDEETGVGHSQKVHRLC